MFYLNASHDLPGSLRNTIHKDVGSAENAGAIFSPSCPWAKLPLLDNSSCIVLLPSIHGHNRTAFLAHCGIPSVHGHNRTAFLAHCGIPSVHGHNRTAFLAHCGIPSVHGHKKGHCFSSGLLKYSICLC